MERLLYTLIIIAALPQVLSAQSLLIGTGTSIRLHGSCHLRCNNANLKVNGSLKSSPTSLIAMSNSSQKTIGGNGELEISTLKVAGDVATTRDLHINGDLVLEHGIFDIQENNVYLKGELLGETSNTYLTASTGEVVSSIHLQAHSSNNALGLQVSTQGNHDVEVRRGHHAIRKNGGESVNRYYSFFPPIAFDSIGFTLLPHERNSVERPTIHSYIQGEWVCNQSANGTMVSAKGIGEYVELVSAFASASKSLYIPKSFSPNSDGVNDYFEIVGNYDNPNSRLIIFAPNSSQVMYDRSPYLNDFTGDNLPTGTYFYVFYKDKNEKTPQKGFVELVR